jgi:hypothetical protein
LASLRRLLVVTALTPLIPPRLFADAFETREMFFFFDPENPLSARRPSMVRLALRLTDPAMNALSRDVAAQVACEAALKPGNHTL